MNMVAPAETKPALKEAVDLTTRTIDCRAFHYRNLVILLVLVVVVSGVWAAVRWSGLPLLGLLLLAPLCAAFILLDTTLVNRWRRRVLGWWVEGCLPLDNFANAVASLRMLPPGTVRAMVGTLPTRDRVPAAAKAPPVLRRALADTLKAIHRGESARTAIAGLAYSVGAASLALAALLGDWLPLAGVALVLPVIGLGWGLAAVRWRSWRRAIRTLRKEQGLDLPGFTEAADQLDWGSIPDRKKRRLLGPLGEAREGAGPAV
jgi:hypothetical protein